jgi:hypothetical protein
MRAEIRLSEREMRIAQARIRLRHAMARQAPVPLPKQIFRNKRHIRNVVIPGSPKSVRYEGCMLTCVRSRVERSRSGARTPRMMICTKVTIVTIVPVISTTKFRVLGFEFRGRKSNTFAYVRIYSLIFTYSRFNREELTTESEFETGPTTRKGCGWGKAGARTIELHRELRLVKPS